SWWSCLLLDVDVRLREVGVVELGAGRFEGFVVVAGAQGCGRRERLADVLDGAPRVGVAAGAPGRVGGGDDHDSHPRRTTRFRVRVPPPNRPSMCEPV